MKGKTRTTSTLIVLANILKIASMGLALVLLYRSVWFHGIVVSLPSPQEFREDMCIVVTDAIRGKLLPYTKSTMPLLTNVYGIIYPLVMAPVTAIFGSTYRTHRITTWFFWMCSFLLTFYVLRKRKIPVGMAVIGIIIWYSQVLENQFDILSRPEGLGELFFLLGICIPWIFHFRFASLIASVILSLLGFFTKPYFILGAPIVFLYLLFFVSRKKAVLFGIVFSVFGITAFLVTQYLMEFYFYNTVLFHLKNARYFVSHMMLQTKVFTINNIGLVVLAVYGYANALRRRKIDYFQFLFLCFLLIVLGKLGGHDGNYLAYYTELLVPLLLIASFGSDVILRREVFCHICIIATLAILLLRSSSFLTIDRPAILKNWGEWENLLSSYGKIYNTPPFAKYLSDANKEIFDEGHTEYFTKSMTRLQIPLFDDAREAYNTHLHTLDRMIQNKEFDLIIRLKDYVQYDFLYTGYLSYFIEKNYSMREIKPLLMYHNQKLLFEVWERKKY